MDLNKLETLGDLKDKGILTEAEFKEQKNNILKQSLPAEKGTSLWNYFVECMLRKYACFTGRARRKEYFGYALFYALIILTVSAFFFICLDEQTANILSKLFLLAFYCPSFAVLTRRLHDVGHSGWWIGANFIAVFVFFFATAFFSKYHAFGNLPFKIIGFLCLATIIVSNLAILIWIFFKSDMKENKYGPVPKGVK